MKLHESIGLPVNIKAVGICGGGGKTSLMYALAREAEAQGFRTAIMTTTHIGVPRDPLFHVFTADVGETELEQVWAEGDIPLPASRGRERGLNIPSDSMVKLLWEKADRIYYEADGSKNFPIKYPGSWEPVILEGTSAVILVAGLSAVGSAPECACQRLELARAQMDIPEGPVSEETMASVLAAGYGPFDPYIFLNQADGPVETARGERVREHLRRKGLNRVFIGSLKRMGLACNKF